MRLTIHGAVALAAALALPGLVAAQSTPNSGGIYTDCSSGGFNPVPIQAGGGEFYSIKVAQAPGEDYNDWMFDLRARAGGQAPSADASGGENYIVLGGNFTEAEAGTDVFFNIFTFPNGMIALDSATVGLPDAGNMQVVSPQFVGNALPTGELDGTGLTLTATPYAVPGIVNRGAGAGTFPYGTRDGIEVAFGALVDVNNTDVAGGLGCSWGGAARDPNLSTGHGMIMGYNVYRMASATEPTRAALGVPANFQYMLRIDQFNMSTPDTPGMAGPDINGDGLGDGDGTNAPTDPNADTDLTGLHNAAVDVTFAYTGDEVVLFQDFGNTPGGVARATGTAPVLGMNYWYGFQPVVRGSVGAFTAANIAKRGVMDHRVDMGMDGSFDAVNLDLLEDPTASSLEFISPQAAFGLPGLGLTNNGQIMLSQPVMGAMNAAAAIGRVDVTVTVDAGNVNVQFQSALEGGNVLGYNVIRVVGDARQQVNEQLIAARGGEGNVYRVIDAATDSARRTRRDAAASYGVEVVYNDGTAPQFIGPFEVTTSRENTRRQR